MSAGDVMIALAIGGLFLVGLLCYCACAASNTKYDVDKSYSEILRDAEWHIRKRPKLWRYDGVDQIAMCPNCGEIMNQTRHEEWVKPRRPYCCYCGQRIDWEGIR